MFTKSLCSRPIKRMDQLVKAMKLEITRIESFHESSPHKTLSHELSPHEAFSLENLRSFTESINSINEEFKELDLEETPEIMNNIIENICDCFGTIDILREFAAEDRDPLSGKIASILSLLTKNMRTVYDEVGIVSNKYFTY